MTKINLIPNKASKPSKPSDTNHDVYEYAKNIHMNAMLKNFPNGDPSFFIPSFALKGRFDEGNVTKPYSRNAWVYAACTAITTPLIPLPKVLDLKKAKEETDPITENEILTLLEKPNPLMDGPTFWEFVMLFLLLPTSNTKGGQCFIVSEGFTDDGVDLSRGQMPQELFPFSDEFFTPVISKEDGMLIGWKYKVPNSNKEILYRPEEVIRIHLVDPESPLKGQAPIWAAKSGLRQDSKASLLNENFFDNNASLGGMLSTDAELTDDIATELRQNFEEKYSGQDKAGRVPLLHSGLKYQMFQQTHQDMQFLEQKKWTRDEILAVYKVPKFAVALYEDLNLATAKEAVRIFWNQTLLPLDNRILRAFNNQWICNTNSGLLELQSDLSKVPALQPDLDLKLAQAEKLAKLGVPLSEINRRLELQLDLKNVAWADTWLISPLLQPAERNMLEPLPEEPPPGGIADEEEDSGSSHEDDDNTGHEGDDEEEGKTNSPNPEKLGIDDAINNLVSIAKASDEEQRAKNKYIKDIIEPDIKKFDSILRKYLIQQRNKVLDNVDTWLSSLKSNDIILPHSYKANTPSTSQLVGNIAKENKRLQKVTLPEYKRQALRESKVLNAQLTKLEFWKFNSPSMKKIIRLRLKQVTSINTTTFKIARNEISKAVAQAVSEGLTQKQTSKLIKNAVSKVYKGRINTDTIARTETQSIHSQTRNDVYNKEKITKIKWLTSGGPNVRDVDDSDFPHTILDGVTAERKDGFDNGEVIMYPLDPAASAGNTINCECIFIAVK